MPYYESPHGSGKRRYVDPLKCPESTGLDGVVEHIQQWMWRNQHEWWDKYDLFNKFPLLEQLDYSRLQYEASHPVRVEDKREDWAYCCWPYPCVMCAAIGCSVHWPWRAHFEKKLPYWRKDISLA